MIEEKLGHFQVLSRHGRMQGRPAPHVVTDHVCVTAGVEKSTHIGEHPLGSFGTVSIWSLPRATEPPNAGSRLYAISK